MQVQYHIKTVGVTYAFAQGGMDLFAGIFDGKMEVRHLFGCASRYRWQQVRFTDAGAVLVVDIIVLR